MKQIKLHSTQKKLLRAIAKDKKSTYEQLQEKCGIKHLSLVEYHINQLKAYKIIEKVNEWKISDKWRED